MNATDDEREELAQAVYYWDVSENVGSKTWERLTDRQRDVWREAAGAILAAGFRRQGPITDETVKAALDGYESAMQEHAKHGLAMRTALEAAERARHA